MIRSKWPPTAGRAVRSPGSPASRWEPVDGCRETVRRIPVGICVPASTSNSERLYAADRLTVCRVAYRPLPGYAKCGPTRAARIVALLLAGMLGSAAPARSQSPQIFYETDGTGEALVLVPDWAHDTGSWFRLLPLLRQEDRRLVRYDLRGQGRSGAPADGDYSLPAHRADLLRLLDGLGIDRAHLVGTGLGATVVLGFALEHPERAISVTAIDPRLGWRSEERAEWEQLLEAWERVGRPTLGEYTSVLVARWLGTDFIARNAWTVAWYDLMLRRQSAAALIESMRAYLAAGWEGEEAAPVDVPALLLLGERWEGARDSGNLGPAFPIQWREQVDDAGAQPALDAPGELAERLREFLERVSPDA